MTTEQLRTKLLFGFQAALGSAFARRMLGAEGVKVLTAQRAYWSAAGTAELEVLLKEWEKLP